MTKVRDGLYGLIVADALGVPAESRTREDGPFPKKWTRKMRKKQNEANRSE